MELRLRAARTTKDIDLSLPLEKGQALGAGVLNQLQRNAALDLGDFFTFTLPQQFFHLRCIGSHGWISVIFSGETDRYSISLQRTFQRLRESITRTFRAAIERQRQSLPPIRPAQAAPVETCVRTRRQLA